MRLRLIATGFAFGVGLATLTGQVASNAEQEKSTDKDAEFEAMMERWREYALPGPFHEELEVREGNWDVTTRAWWEGPDAEPHVNHANATSRLIFGGRFLETRLRGTISFEYKGETMEFPNEGIGYAGYDNFKQKYVSIWIDSSGTGIYYSEGTLSPDGNAVVSLGQWDEWETGEHDKWFKLVDRVVNQDKLVFEMYELVPEIKIMEMIWERKR